MSDFFKDISLSPKKMEEKLLGPNYKYYKYIRTPTELGMSDDGSMGALADDVIGLINYAQVLIAGTGPASMTGKPLGNRFFLKTGAECKSKSGKMVDRYTYFDNIPDGSIPFGPAGITFKTFRGLVPGIMNNIDQMNPVTLFSGFMDGGEPDCTEICMPTMTVDNQPGSKCFHVVNSEIESINPCIFPSKRNPVSGDGCRSGFVGTKKTAPKYTPKNLKNEPFANMYILGFSLFLLYLLVKGQSK
jgi:hypothetical protein